MTEVSVIIVNFNGRHLLGELLESLSRQTRPADEVILVDNASTDGSVDYVRRDYPWVQVVVSAANIGFAGGNNLGLSHARGDYIALLNSDTVADEEWLCELVRLLEADELTGVVVSKIYVAGAYPMIDCAGAEFNNLGFSWGRGSRQLDRGQFDTPVAVPAATACAMVLRRKALGEAALFDQHLFMYYEELDFSLRIRGSGYNIVYAPAAIVYHKGSQSISRAYRLSFLSKQFYGNRNRIKILVKYYPFAVLIRSLPLICFSLIYWNTAFLLGGGPLFFLRAVAAQIQYASRGFVERLRGNGVEARLWLPWMKYQGLRELWALKSRFYGGVS